MFYCAKQPKSSYGKGFVAISSYAIISKVKLSNLIMEPGRVELPSAPASNFPLIHRFSHSVPHGGVYQLALTVRLSGMNLRH